MTFQLPKAKSSVGQRAIDAFDAFRQNEVGRARVSQRTDSFQKDALRRQVIPDSFAARFQHLLCSVLPAKAAVSRWWCVSSTESTDFAPSSATAGRHGRVDQQRAVLTDDRALCGPSFERYTPSPIFSQCLRSAFGAAEPRNRRDCSSTGEAEKERSMACSDEESLW